MKGKGLLLKYMTLFRVFIIGALFASGVVELWAVDFFSTPLEQLSVGAVAGALAVVGAKIVHLV